MIGNIAVACTLRVSPSGIGLKLENRDVKDNSEITSPAVYATGRGLTYNEVNFLKQDAMKLRAGGYRMQDMIRYVVSSRIFLEK